MSKAKKLDLAGAVHGAARAGSGPAASVATAPARPVRARASSREGTRGVLIRVERALSRRLRQLALDEDTSVQALGVEAFEALLQARGR